MAIKLAMGNAHLKEVPLDNRSCMQSQALKEMIERDMAAGLKPFLIIASAGTTDVGAIDPLDHLADIAEEYDLWFHIDAAYGGFFMLCEELKQLFKGIDRSHSMVIDPHKGLFLPYGIGIVIVSDGEKLMASHSYQANYLQDAVDAQAEISPADLSPELTKHFRGLKAIRSYLLKIFLLLRT